MRGWRGAADAGDEERQTSSRGPTSSRGRAALAFATYAVIAVLWLIKAWVPSGGRSGPVGSHGDPLLFVWYLGWMPFALEHGLSPLFTKFLMAPDGANLLINTSVLLPSLVLSPITRVWGPVVAYNALITVSLAASAWAAYMVCRRITGSELGAFLCGLLYGFGAYMQAQSLAHAHLALAVFPPFALLMVHELAVEQRRPAGRVGALLGLGCVAQLLTGEELLATTIVLAGLLVVVLALMYRDQIRRRAAHLLRGLGAAAAVGAVLGGPVVAYELFGPRHVNSLLQQRNTYVADLAGFIVPTRLEWLSTAGARELSAKFTGFSGEYSVYLGAPLLLIVGFAAWRLRSQPAARVASFMAAASALLSLGSFLHVFGHRTRIPMPWLPLSHVPLMESAAPDRLALFTALAVGVLVALLIRDLAQTRARVRLVSWGAIAVAVVAIVPNVPAPVASLDVPRFFESRSVSMIPAGTIAVVFPRQSGSYLAMAAQIRSKFRFRLAQGGVFTPEGFDSASSSVYELLIAAEERRPPRGSAAACVQVDQGISDRCRRIVAADLRRRQVGAVIIMNASGAGAISELFSSYFGRPPINAGGVRLWLLRTAQEQTHPPSTAAR